MDQAITDTERLDWLIANTTTWTPRMLMKERVLMPCGGYEVVDRWIGGTWDDGHPNYGGGGETITPEADNPRTAIDLAIKMERGIAGIEGKERAD